MLDFLQYCEIYFSFLVYNRVRLRMLSRCCLGYNLEEREMLVKFIFARKVMLKLMIL